MARGNLKPRLDPYKRLHSRFYETLYLLCILGREQGPQLVVSHDELSHVATRRRFLQNLAFICDHKKGGDTVTAIALESRDDGYIFWVSSNEGADERVTSFLASVLHELRSHAASNGTLQREEAEDNLRRECVEFAARRVKKEGRVLASALRNCRQHLVRQNVDDEGNEARAAGPPPDSTPKSPILTVARDSGLDAWLGDIESSTRSTAFAMCQKAYQIRHDRWMSTLSQLGREPDNGVNASTSERDFRCARHFIGRLAARLRAVRQLLDDVGRVSNLLDRFSVAAVALPPCAPGPLADNHTTLSGSMDRMASATSDVRYREIRHYLSALESQVEIEEKLLEFHQPDQHVPRVHAEIQMLHHFYEGGLGFAMGDRYIACSKPACFCCKLYFRHHPAACVQPDSHQTLFANWGLIDLPGGSQDPGYKTQRTVLNGIRAELCEALFREIEERQAASFWHPISLTGITTSTNGYLNAGESSGLHSERTAVFDIFVVSRSCAAQFTISGPPLFHSSKVLMAIADEHYDDSNSDGGAAL